MTDDSSFETTRLLVDWGNGDQAALERLLPLVEKNFIALNRLAAIDERKSHVVELRYFGGLDIDETAEVLKVSPTTVMRDWKFARAWLSREIEND